MPIVIEQLNIFPVKSLGGISLLSATLTTTGLAGDREWMLVDEKGKFATQRKLPLLATIKPSIIDNKLVLTNRDGDSIVLEKPVEESLIDISLWKDRFKALETNMEYSQWITDSINSTKPLKLVYFDKQYNRGLDSTRFGEGHTYFSDGAPFLVTNVASLDALNKTLESQQLAPAAMDRFRANIVISGLPAFEEHNIKELHSNASPSVIALKDHCSRCAVITVDQSTGLRSKGAYPFKQLAQLNAMPNNSKAPAFGVNSILMSGEGDTVSCQETFDCVI